MKTQSEFVFENNFSDWFKGDQNYNNIFFNKMYGLIVDDSFATVQKDKNKHF